LGLAAGLLFARPAFAQSSTVSAADTAWMIVATALVLMMTIPGLALFYSGMVRMVSELVPLRVSRAQELEGLDISQHGEALQ
jgi:ammonium transporter, Amt family